MAETRRRTVGMRVDARNDDVMAVSESSSPMDIESARTKLRQRWELASVLNFLHVLEPVIESGLKISAEELETALIVPNNTLATLHTVLLKGINPESKTLKSKDGWIFTLIRILTPWWEWVAEGDFPLTGVAKGEELSMYKKFDPTTRLLILKALCEVRAEQPDVAGYINEEIKNGAEVSDFRKDKLAGDGNRITFWYDGNEVIGHRLYKEVNEYKKVKGKDSMPVINSQWETIATNLDEFKKIVTEFSSSEVGWEAALSSSVEADIVPVVEKIWKKKQRIQKQQERQQMLLSGLRNSGITRSCRNQKPIDYRYDDYDRAITRAIQYVNKRKAGEEQGREEKQSHREKRRATTSNGSHNSETNSSNNESTETDAEIGSDQSGDDDEEEEYDGEKEVGINKDSGKSLEDIVLAHRPRGSRFSERLAGVPGHTVPESLNLGAKNRLRQRPSVNTAAEHVVVPDSEDE